MEISVKADIKTATRHLTRIQRKQIPFATSLALNDTAFDGMHHARKMAKRLLHKPIGYTIKGIRYSKSTKRKLKATVFVNEWPDKGTAQAKYLMPQITGGARAAKGSERAFRRAGILPAGKYMAPTKKYTNAAGNVKPGLMQMIMSQLKAFSEQGYTANATNKTLAKKNTKFFLIRGTGIFTRTRRGPEAVLLFIDKPNYKARFPFSKIVNKRARRTFPGHFRKRMAEALRTAK
jgi:hypothetical protein